MLADVNLADLLWSMTAFFFFVIILWMIFGIIGDIFRSDDLSGVSKALWCVFIVLAPWLAIFIYLIARGHGMSTRALKSNQDALAKYGSYGQPSEGMSAAAGEIKSAKELLDSGAISQSEFDRIKSQALAA